MGRHSRSRQVQRKKIEAATPMASGMPREDEEESPSGGSLMSMRAGFKNIAGTAEGEGKASAGGSILGWVVLGVVIIALIMFFIAR